MITATENPRPNCARRPLALGDVLGSLCNLGSCDQCHMRIHVHA